MTETQFEILKTELLLTQGQVDKYDQFGTTIKTWSVTLWVASSGWAFQSGRKELLLISIALVFVFWFFEGINKTFRLDYKRRRDEVAALLNGIFKSGKLPDGASAPQLPSHDSMNTLKNAFRLHVALPYLILATVSVILFYIT